MIYDVVESIERRAQLTPMGFADYVAARKPVIMPDFCADWPARQRWNADYLKQLVGPAYVEIMAGRNADPAYERNYGPHRHQTRFANFIDYVMQSEGNNAYMVANNHFMEGPLGQRLLADIRFGPHLDANQTHGRVFLWMGPKGTVTPLHYDNPNIIFAQVVGSKRFLMFSPANTSLLYNFQGVFSEVDCLNPDLKKYPAYAAAHQISCDLHAGEALFIPSGWWHHVQALSASISVSFTNLRNN